MHWVTATDENGWGADVGSVAMKHLKKLGDGKFGA